MVILSSPENQVGARITPWMPSRLPPVCLGSCRVPVLDSHCFALPSHSIAFSFSLTPAFQLGNLGQPGVELYRDIIAKQLKLKFQYDRPSSLQTVWAALTGHKL